MQCCNNRFNREPNLLCACQAKRYATHSPFRVHTFPPGCYSLVALRLAPTCFVFMFADRYAFHMLVRIPSVARTRDATKEEIRDKALLRTGKLLLCERTCCEDNWDRYYSRRSAPPSPRRRLLRVIARRMHALLLDADY